MFCCKKKSNSREPEDENPVINFDWVFLIARTRLGISQKEAEYMLFGKWLDIFQSYKELYNFETKRLVYKDVEDEMKRIQMENEPEVSLADL